MTSSSQENKILDTQSLDTLERMNGQGFSNHDRIAALVHPLSPETFLSDVWPGTFQHFEGSVSRLSELIDQPEFSDIETLVRSPISGSIRADYTRVGKDSEMDVKPERAVELYHSACTIYLSRLATDTAKRWMRTLDAEFGLIPGTTQINAFASIAGRGLSWHWDPQEIFIVQVRGRKLWHVAPNEYIDWPTVSGQAGAERRPDIRPQLKDPTRPVERPKQWQTIEMTPGSVLFLPRGYWHTTENIDESLHLVLQMKMPSWRDFFVFLFQSAPELYDLDWRRPTSALQPQNLLASGIGELQDRCQALSSFASIEKMSELAKLFGAIRGEASPGVVKTGLY